MKKLLSHPLFSGSVVMIGGNMFANVINFFYQSVMGKNLLTQVQYGELSSLFAIIYIVIIVPQSTSASIVKFVSSAKNHQEVAFIYKNLTKIINYLAVVLAVLVVLLSPLISGFLHVDILGVVLIAPVLFFSLITLINQATMQGALKFWGNVGPNIMSALAKLTFGIIFVVVGWQVGGAMLGVLLGVMFAYAYSYFLTKKFLKDSKPKGKFDVRKFIKYSFPVLIYSFAFTSLFTTDIILVKHFLPEVQAGIYAALSTLGKIIYFAASPIAGTMFPLVAGRHSRGEEYFKLLMTALVVTFAISFGAVGFYFLFPNIAIGLLYGSQYLVASAELVWMGFFICFYTVSYFMVNFFLSIDETKIVILPFIFAILQIVIIWFYHSSLLSVIQISLVLMVMLFIILFLYLVYNRLNYAKAKK